MENIQQYREKMFTKIYQLYNMRVPCLNEKQDITLQLGIPDINIELKCQIKDNFDILIGIYKEGILRHYTSYLFDNKTLVNGFNMNFESNKELVTLITRVENLFDLEIIDFKYCYISD